MTVLINELADSHQFEFGEKVEFVAQVYQCERTLAARGRIRRHQDLTVVIFSWLEYDPPVLWKRTDKILFEFLVFRKPGKCGTTFFFSRHLCSSLVL